MKLNSLLYPAPSPSYKADSFSSEMIFIPRVFHRDEVKFQKKLKSEGILTKQSLLNPDLHKTNIPALFLPCNTGSSKLLIYFHANAEDIGLAYPMLDCVR